MSDDVAVVWLDQASAHDEAARALDGWARSRGVRLVPAPAPAPAAAVDLSLSDRAEKELERARDAIGGLDADTAERALARAEQLLREHPELPNAAWLRAEVMRTWSARWLRLEPRDEARARAAWENARALDGGRVAGVGEASFPPLPSVKARIVVSGAPRLAIRLDGLPVPALATRMALGARAEFEVETAPAEHQVVVTSGDRVVFASWIGIAGAAPAPTILHVTDPGSCDREQLAGVRRAGEGVDATGVACPRWVAAAPASRPGSVLVARCDRDACGPLLEWRVERPRTEGPPQPRSAIAGWPPWATWALAGIGVATATSIAVLATGAFERRPVEPRFVVGGARQE